MPRPDGACRTRGSIADSFALYGDPTCGEGAGKKTRTRWPCKESQTWSQVRTKGDQTKSFVLYFSSLLTAHTLSITFAFLQERDRLDVRKGIYHLRAQPGVGAGALRLGITRCLYTEYLDKLTILTAAVGTMAADEWWCGPPLHNTCTRCANWHERLSHNVIISSFDSNGALQQCYLSRGRGTTGCTYHFFSILADNKLHPQIKRGLSLPSLAFSRKPLTFLLPPIRARSQQAALCDRSIGS